MPSIQEKVFLAKLEDNLLDSSGNEFTAKGEPTFLEDPIVGKYMKAPNNGYIHINNPLFAVGVGDFTLDAWINVKGGFCSISTSTVTSDIGASIWPGPGQHRTFIGTGYAGKEVFINGMKHPVAGWAHYALVRKDGKCYGFINGVLIGTNTCTFALVSERIAINTAYTNQLDRFVGNDNGYKAVRFSNFARWTETFNPPKPKDDEEIEEKPIDMNLHILMEIEEKVNLIAHVLPILPSDKEVVWSSEDSTIATVDINGIVTANGVGYTKIHVATKDGSWSAFARIKIIAKGAKKMRLSVLLQPKESCQFTSVFVPEYLEEPVVWHSSNEKVATVDIDGKVTAVSEGVAFILVKTIDGSFSDFMYVTVNDVE